MKKVLVPVDFSENAKKALEYACRLFLNQPVKFFVVNAYFPPVAGPEVPVSISNVLKSHSEESMDEFLSDFKSDVRFADLDIISECIYGDVEYVVEKHTAHHNIDYVVMGTKGATGLKEILVGSTTSAVLDRIKVPILVIPEGVKFSGLNKILLAVDYRETNKQVIEPLLFILSFSNTEVSILNIHEKSQLTEKSIASEGLVFTESLNVKDHVHLFMDNHDLESEIENFVEERNIDLITMVKHEQNFWEKLFHKDKAQKMCMHSHIPLLILNE